MKAAEIVAFANSITSVRVTSLLRSCELRDHVRVIARMLEWYDFSTKLKSSPFYLDEGQEDRRKDVSLDLTYASLDLTDIQFLQ